MHNPNPKSRSRGDHEAAGFFGPGKRFASSSGFTLVELLAVIAIMTVLAAATSISIAGMASAGALDNQSAVLSDTFAQARSYAMANDTYVYVGLEELNAAQPTSSGVGRLVVAVVAATGGTRPYGNTPGALPDDAVVPVARLQVFDNLHITSDATLTSGAITARPPATTTGFIDLSQATSSVSFQWPLSGTPLYLFTKVVEFNPQGVARFQSQTTLDDSVPSYIELPLLPTHGTVLPAVPSNEVAIQVDGMTGVARTYRP
jgi:prepilin-type N-terminal cleavage/methylation domain-containing protein